MNGYFTSRIQLLHCMVLLLSLHYELCSGKFQNTSSEIEKCLHSSTCVEYVSAQTLFRCCCSWRLLLQCYLHMLAALSNFTNPSGTSWVTVSATSVVSYILALLLFVSSQHSEFIFKVAYSVQQDGSVSLGSLVGLPACFLDLPFIPALHLQGHGIKKVLRNLKRMHVLPLLGERSLSGAVVS